MAEIDKETFGSFNLGILDTEIVGNIDAAEAFFSDAPIAEEKKEEAPKKEEPKVEEKKVEEEKPIDPLEETEGEKKEETTTEEEKEGFDYAAFSRDLFNIGVLTEMEDEPEIKTPEDLVIRLNHEKQLGASNYLESFLAKFGDDRREMFDAIFVNGVDPKEYLPVFNKVEDLKGLDITQDDAQKYVFREFYRRVGLDEVNIEKKLQKAIDYGDLESDSKEFYPKLIDQDEKKLEKMSSEKKAAEDNQKRIDQEYKLNIQKKLTEAVQAKELKGVPITQQKANEVFDFIYTPKYKTADGKFLTEFDKFVLESKKPENLEQRLLLGLLKLDNFDFTKIEKQGVSKESKSLFSEMASKVVKSKTRDINKIPESKSSWSHL